MIHVQRGPAPSALNSPEVKAEIKRAKDIFSKSHEERSKHRFVPKLLPSKVPELRESLLKAFNGKCAFCETKFINVPGHVENFRPRSGAVDNDGRFSPEHYWWLTFDWNNLLPVCINCNRAKENRFPVLNERVAEGMSGEALKAESPLLLDPCDKELSPEHLFVYDEQGLVASTDERGRVTIEMLKLNRPSLVRARRDALRHILHLFDLFTGSASEKTRERDHRLALEKLYEALEQGSEFLAIKRQFIQHHAAALSKKTPSLKELLAPFVALRTSLTEKKTTSSPAVQRADAQQTVKKFKTDQKKRDKFSVEGTKKELEEYYLKRQIIDRIKISNFNAIHHLDLKFPPIDEKEKCSWLLLLGENAVGKTSVLEAVAIALAGERERRILKLRPQKFLRHGADSGYIKVYFNDSDRPIEVTFNKRSRVFKVTPSEQGRPRVISAAYGVTRLLPGARVRRQPSYKASKPHNLFNPLFPLVDSETWLKSLNDRKQPSGADKGNFTDFELIVRDVNALLLLKGKDSIFKNKAGKIKVRLFGEETALSELSMGYQSIVALTTDIMSVLHYRWKSMEVAEGIVLIDELDSHLHPRWKMLIVKRLRQVFPSVQFLVTSHDPLTLRGLHKGEAVVIRRNRRHRPFAITDLPAPDAMSAEQILTSGFFGLNSTVDPEVEESFDEYYELLASTRLNSEQQARLAELKAELKGLKHLGTTRREQLMLEAADEFLAKRDYRQDYAAPRLKASTRQKIAAIWSGRRNRQ